MVSAMTNATPGDPDLCAIDPELAEVLASQGKIWEFPDDINLTKKTLTAPSSPPQSTEYMTEEDLQIAVRDGASVRIRVHTPRNRSEDGFPLFVIYHGGGFCIGNLDTEVGNVKMLCELGFVVVNVDYRLAPEHPFPVGVNDAWDALQWTAKNAKALKADPSKGFIVGGTSAGANFAAVVSHLARDKKLEPPLTGVFLSAPSIVDDMAIPDRYKHELLSFEQNKDAPLFNTKDVRMFHAAYDADPTNALFSPLWTSSNSYANLPPTFFQVCGMDPCRDGALIYERELREGYGIRTRMKVYPGLPHAFWAICPQLKFSRKYVEDSLEGFKWLLS